jgi:hypothetical protein
VDYSTLSTRTAALVAIDTLEGNLAKCTSTFTAEQAYANAGTGGTASFPVSATPSCAGSVAIDINGNGKVDYCDAVELFVATTMQDFGAASILNRFRKKHPTGAMTPIETVIANVKAAMAHGP